MGYSLQKLWNERVTAQDILAATRWYEQMLFLCSRQAL
jgi:hypothetical protein